MIPNCVLSMFIPSRDMYSAPNTIYNVDYVYSTVYNIQCACNQV